MAKTEVIHVRDFDASRGDIYIGRAVPRKGLKASPWANPFRIGESHPALGYKMKRADVISAFVDWVRNSTDPRAAWIREHVHELRGKRLACWCAPKPCHGDVLAELADKESE